MVEFIPVVLAQRLGIDPDDTGDVGFGDTISRHRLHLAAFSRFRSVRLSSHCRVPL
jgi:hypothetical protein